MIYSPAMKMFGCECTGPSVLGCGGPKCNQTLKNKEVEYKSITDKLDIIIALLKSNGD